MSTPPPTFGRRNALQAPGMMSPAVESGDPHAAFFAAIRQELHPTDERPLVVRDSLLSAILAGIVVGCALVGLDITGTHLTASPLGDLVAIEPGSAALGPVLILLGLIGGGRAAATSLLVAHKLLKRAGQTHHAAYAAGGALAASAVAGVMFAITGHASHHGWAIDVLAGAAGGFFYRVFAGTRRG